MSQILDVLQRHRFRYENEIELQNGIDIALTKAGLKVDREVQLNESDRIDMLVGNVGIEVKVDGSGQNVLRQLHRYAHCEQIGSLILVTNRAHHRLAIQKLNGKPVSVHFIVEAWL